MKGLHPKYPHQDFEFNARDDGFGLVIAFDLQGFLTGIEYAKTQGWQTDIESNHTVKLGSQYQVRIFKVDENSVETEDTSNQVSPENDGGEELVSDEVNSPVEVNFEELRSLENNKNNRKQVDDLAKSFSIEIDRRKFKTVRAIVDEFESQMSK